MEKNEKNIFDLSLSSFEAAKLLLEHGENTLFKKKRSIPLFVFLKKLGNPLFLLMLAISIVSFAVGQFASASIMIMMIFLSATLDFLNSYKSQQAVEKLVSRVSLKVTVIRDRQKQEINPKGLVPGDMVLLSAGNIVPADCQILESDDFFVNQSSLTGESIPVEKTSIMAAAKEGGVDEDQNLAFMGTSVVSGFAVVRVKSTGIGTEFGKIAERLNSAEPKTDFEISITKFSLFIMKLVFFMVSVVFIIYLIKNVHDLNKKIILEAFAFALAITIGVTPDMLPAIITVCLSKGSRLMAKKEVIVKHLAAIENFGSMDILCTDKTGTLTQDHITLVKSVDYLGNNSDKVLELGFLSSYFHTGVENPLDAAIKENKHLADESYKKVDEIPYDFTRKRSSMVVQKDGIRTLITKGAPEEIVKICTSIEIDGRVEPSREKLEILEKKFAELSQDGFRVLSICYKIIENDQAITAYDKENEKEMVFSGFLAFLDPPKESVSETLIDLKRLGIEIKILTGDNDLLTEKICRDIGFEIKGVLTGAEIASMNDLELSKRVTETNIFARVAPDQKERIILILKKAGKSVGFLGDGINDAPALRAADVGISVNNAVDIAKETADIILMQKSLKSLEEGVIEGRKTFHNTLKYILMGLSSNFGNMFSMMGASAFLPFLPMLPAQVLFNNFIYDVSQFSLPSDAVDEDDLLKPAHWDLKFIRTYMLVFGLMSSIFDFLTFFLLYYVYHLSAHQFQTGWFIESIATQIFVIYVIRTKKIPFIQSRPSRALFITTFLAVVFAWSVQFTILGQWMNFDRLPFYIMGIIFSYVIIYLFLVEGAKRVFYRYYGRKAKLKLVN